MKSYTHVWCYRNGNSYLHMMKSLGVQFYKLMSFVLSSFQMKPSLLATQ